MNPQTGGKPKERLDVQLLHDGMITSVSVSMIFPNKLGIFGLIGVLNSEICVIFPRIMGLDKDISAGYLSKIPIVEPNEKIEFLTKEAYSVLREHDTGNEVSTQFIIPWLLQVWRGFSHDWKPVTNHPLSRDFTWSDFESAKEIRGEGKIWDKSVGILALANECVHRELNLRKRLDEIQNAIDDEIYRIYNISEEDRELIEKELSTAIETEDEEIESETEENHYEAMPAEEHIKRLLSYFALEVMKEDEDGIVPVGDMFLGTQKEPGMATRVLTKLTHEFGEANLDRIEHELSNVLGMSIDEWFAQGFFGYHTTLYRLRPVIWQISSEGLRKGKGGMKPAFNCFIYWHKLTEDTVPKVRQLYFKPLFEAARREADNVKVKLSKVEGREKRNVETELESALNKYEELRTLDETFEKLLKPHELKVTSKSDWVKEKVKEITEIGYKPERDYGVRVNIEPLIQAGIMPKTADRVKG